MDREEIKHQVIGYFRQQAELLDRPGQKRQIHMGNLRSLVQDSIRDIPPHKHDEVFSVVREVVQEFINTGFLYPGLPADFNSSYPWLTITEYGKEAFIQENWLPYDPDGYLKALTERIPEIDDVTLAYIGESVSAFNRRYMLSATLTLE
jgi:hypothetical protein